MLKMDIEGSEWKVLERLEQKHFDVLMHIDIEMHWCISRDGQGWEKARAISILNSLTKLNKYFYV